MANTAPAPLATQGTSTKLRVFVASQVGAAIPMDETYEALQSARLIVILASESYGKRSSGGYGSYDPQQVLSGVQLWRIQTELGNHLRQELFELRHVIKAGEGVVDDKNKVLACLAKLGLAGSGWTDLIGLAAEDERWPTGQNQD